ncbi:MAG: MaoC family dehydratase N-terminal domain-containing protein [Rudaea sp.]|uniref:FAS1-like dehydratase domain-containing protein n=1 Tax=Rudaea sp. TaxID=2136325 RepID=UPI0039E2274A
MIDRSYIGYRTTPTIHRVEPWRVKLFCEAIGETDAVFWDREAARARGFDACPVPPTFLKAIESEHCNSADLLKIIGVPLRGVLHAEQRFEHEHAVHAGDDLEVSREILDIYDKRNGALHFIVIETRFRLRGESACRSMQNVAVRNPGSGKP